MMDVVELIETKKQKEIDKMIHNWKDEGISVQKARWGRFNIIKGKMKIELPKTFDAESLTLEKVLELIEAKKTTKKKATKKKAVKKKVAKKKKKGKPVAIKKISYSKCSSRKVVFWNLY